jgi:hypothetical protein
VRNSSLVEWCRADNITGLKFATEAMDFKFVELVVFLEFIEFVSAGSLTQ